MRCLCCGMPASDPFCASCFAPIVMPWETHEDASLWRSVGLTAYLARRKTADTIYRPEAT